MKIGSIDILKAYLGALELTNSNAFIGTIPVIENGPEPVSYPGLKFTSTGNSTIAISKVKSAPTVDLKYSLDDGKTWTQWDFSEISLSDGQSVCFKGQNTTFATSTYDYNKFVMTGTIAASGNIMSIIDDGACTTTTIPADYCFSYLCKGCSSLTTAPELPATTLANYCYQGMFQFCDGLTTAPALPATRLAYSCYWYMFYKCTSLTTAPELPATILANDCYASMFGRCSKLTTAPELPATKLAQNCYGSMFYNCTNLNYIKCLATNISASRCTSNWVSGVASTGTFVKAASMTKWTTGANGIPSGWTVQNAA